MNVGFWIVTGMMFMALPSNAQLFKEQKSKEDEKAEERAEARAAGRKTTAEPVAEPAADEEPVEIVEKTITTVKRKVKEEAPPPPPPPEPPDAEASEPKRIVRYFCKLWKDEEYEKMWWAMLPSYRQQKSLKAFTKLFEEDKEMTGGLSDENISQDESQDAVDVKLEVMLTFRNKRSKPKKVLAYVRKTPKGYRIVQSGIIPVDWDDL